MAHLIRGTHGMSEDQMVEVNKVIGEKMTGRKIPDLK
jgi:hypothetical protein